MAVHPTLHSAFDPFCSAAATLVATVERLPHDGWDVPGLGEWSMRSLVGHAGRSLSTVVTYCGTPASRVDIESAADYYAAIADRAQSPDTVRRGVTAGRALGADPVARLREHHRHACETLQRLDDDWIVATPVGGMRVSEYLRTRTFELAVHTLDIATAADVEAALPTPVADSALALAGEIAVRAGEARTVLFALTGRSGLPEGFGVLGHARAGEVASGG
ncbi:maleylpyruvate isomerase family mycothiol-dependent enzyme [Rhodococcus rhodnii]|uniref:Mycothiol-dependent maleylpyruvate isomerase metal-binding domain-containing protein n=2 Tax=Rhodococcus rhodnii TaxID=38312 RepID=R7WKT3_9NOCA|nr:maleylpyruvate isomerase family mycothiol-dependent enzyme [Rhodococcus rhodnii]EOM75907.1 hypothetical protein Rrhod_2819 [Rhodococcus rhodnii LMG 5362]TXG91068.1 maleylpyruvate isomerase family mycothiol-dependent enzyme [Rhodococcus rhodnii]